MTPKSNQAQQSLDTKQGMTTKPLMAESSNQTLFISKIKEL